MNLQYPLNSIQNDDAMFQTCLLQKIPKYSASIKGHQINIFFIS